MRRRVVAIDAAAEHGDRRSTTRERAAVRLAVDPARHPADDDRSGGSCLARKEARNRPTIARARPGADDRDGRPCEELDVRLPA